MDGVEEEGTDVDEVVNAAAHVVHLVEKLKYVPQDAGKDWLWDGADRGREGLEGESVDGFFGDGYGLGGLAAVEEEGVADGL
ncbi:hypothetical protein GUITHDRAFT_118863 [Guillardia theta CCMP2712]|uniref:Uncharacterized protein n=1 Tax=Guillardia theta (strain CCMP2712) TaxID=905079 RepID=L1IG84_GUITC|nr:hypothetical protein GUITHDRAFT_118863 [Guillardia theta CCMP2712]EKX34929.1 hypothetical protein GUITHDRAFT_118863 [Guillardia theta CCMP2712]|eukprot:XP_005821909.1 hypothetical protein GUITHDRAFT_118863 [Guillardia theta CCMP2712]